MAPNKKFALLNMSLCDRVQKDMLKACQKVAEDHGLIIEAAGHNNADYGFYFEPVFRVSIPAPDGKAFDPESEVFKLRAKDYGLKPTDLGRVFQTGHDRFKITGIDPRRPRYPISAECLSDRKSFKFDPESVVAFLNKPSKA